MLDKFDYAEPQCPLCDGKEFYYPNPDAPLGRIPVDRIIRKVDGLFDKNHYAEAGRLLEYWRKEAISLKDNQGLLAMESELVGFYRKQGDKEKGLSAVENAIRLIDLLNQGDNVSGATILLNCATAYKAFGMPKEAIPLYNKTEEVYKKLLPSDDARFGGLYNNMALALADLGDFKGAENAYLCALDIMQTKGKLECAITYINLAHLYESFAKEKISNCLSKAYSFLKSDVPHDGYYAFVLEKCAPSFGYFGNTEIYEELMKESKEIYARA